MAIGVFLARPLQFQAVEWDGGNAADVNTVLAGLGWSFDTDADGNGQAHTLFGQTLPVDLHVWVVASAGGGGPQFLAEADFTAQFTAGSSWQVAS